MQIHQLEQFKTIAECRTMREAADRLYLSQPALSQNLKKLEAELGCTLFDRSHNQLALTPYGEILLTHTHRILFDLKEVQEEIEQRKQEDASTIRVGSFYIPLSFFVMPQIANAMPELNFNVTVNSSTTLAKDVIGERIDIAFLPQQFCPAHLESALFCQEELLLSVPPDSPLANQTLIRDADLRNTSLLLPSDFPGLSPWYEEALEKAGVSSELVQHMPMKKYLESMDRTSCAHFTTTMMAMFSGSGSVRPSIPMENEVSPRALCIAYKKDNDNANLVADYILDKRSELFSNHAFIPYLMYQNATSNLSMQFEA